MNSAEKNTLFIKQKATELGFLYCGISKADFLQEEAPRLEKWLKENKHGEMKWMENHFDKRLDPRLLVENAKSVITCLINYYPEENLAKNNQYKISKYAYGTDYHFVIKDKLKKLIEIIKEEIGEVNGRAFVDSAPVMDKAWAVKSGAGWLGKNSNIIRPKTGSFFFIGELIIDLPLLTDQPMKDFCGTCTKCIDACPTQAITEPYVVDGSKCISYLTIELKEQIPTLFNGKMDNWIFGCDICQDVCPWNKFSVTNTIKEFEINPMLKTMSIKDWQEITKDIFNESFRNSPIKRTKWEGIQKNIKFIEQAHL
ncbi:MAG: tRNA epoxyqueuosine(34) reductase QueG [Cytophagales bacterium]|nr:MAG: tRNA epoxyqueuosine(34) reductase QueG [Cytophagales bacterium]